MSLFTLFKKKDFFSAEEKEQMVNAIREAEKQTSGEIRIFIENRCRYLDAVDRALELFTELQMNQTKDRNAVLLYVALKDHQLAIYGDAGIHERTGNEYWINEVKQMLEQFNKQNYVEGICNCIHHIGKALQSYFPYDEETDKNELPDEIIFGK